MERVDIKTEVNRYLQRPFHFAILWVITDILLFAFSGRRAGLIGTAGLLLYLLVAGLFYGRKKSKLSRELVTFAARYGQVQNRLLKEFVLPYALLDSHGTLLWMNDAFAELSGKEENYHKNIAAIYPEITGARLPGEAMRSEVTVEKNGKTYRAALQIIVMEELLEGIEFIDYDEDLERNSVIALYLFDETEYAALRSEREELVAGSYEELMAADEQVYAFRRQGETSAAVVLANLSGERASYDPALVDGMRLLAGTHGETCVGTLRPLEAVVFGA